MDCWGRRRLEPVAQQFKEEGLVEKVKIHPFDINLMLNPLLHEVTEITAGDRFVFVAFIGIGRV